LPLEQDTFLLEILCRNNRNSHQIKGIEKPNGIRYSAGHLFRCSTLTFGQQRKAQMGYRSRGHLIRELLKLLRALDTREAKTAKELSAESGMALRQVYRWVKALDEERIIESLGNNPAKHRLKPEGSRLRRKVRG
jgi:hypothetical protein